MLPWLTIFPGWRRFITVPAPTPTQRPSWGTQEHEPWYPSQCSWISSPGVVTVTGDNPSPSPSSNSYYLPMEKVNTHPPLTPTGTTQGQRNGRDGKHMGIHCTIVCLMILLYESTQDLLRNTAISTVVEYNFCKRCYLSVSCFSQLAQVASHMHPLQTTVNTVVQVLTTKRVMVAAAAA